MENHDDRLFDYMRHADNDDMTLAKTLISFLALLAILAFCIFVAAK